MRREWSGWIKERRWSEFEKLAKSEPSQPLADTVAEMERGFPEKADRKALRKILFLLAQRGYVPTPIETEPEAPEASPAPKEFGFLETPDAGGEAVASYGFEDRGRVRWLIVTVGRRTGVSRASEQEMSMEEALRYAERLGNVVAGPYVSAAVSPAYVLNRIAQAASVTRGPLPPTLAYWRSKLPSAPVEEPHPAEGLERAPADTERLNKLVFEMDVALPWRLELGSVMPVLEEMFRLRNEDGETAKPIMERMLEETREALFTDEVVEDHAGRLLDGAYVMHLRGIPESGVLLTAADELRERRAKSDYAAGLLEKTIAIFVETLRRQSPKPTETNGQ